VEQAVLPPGVTICSPQPVVSGSISGETVTENIGVQYASCLPPEGMEFDEINATPFLGLPPVNQTDEISTDTYLGLPPVNQTDEISTDTYLGLPPVNQTDEIVVTYSVTT